VAGMTPRPHQTRGLPVDEVILEFVAHMAREGFRVTGLDVDERTYATLLGARPALALMSRDPSRALDMVGPRGRVEIRRQ
jgi:hypothetical protein